MTAVRAVRLGRPPVVAVVAMAGAVALLARPWLAPGSDARTAVLVVLFVVLGAAGAWWPLPAGGGSAARRAPTATAALVTAAGLGAFLAGRLLAGGRAAAPALASYLVLNTLAAVAEEAFFRRPGRVGGPTGPTP